MTLRPQRAGRITARSGSRAVVAAMLVGCATVGASSPAAAHSALVSSDPDAGDVLQQPPTTVT